MVRTRATPRAHLGWRIAPWAMLAAPGVFVAGFAARYGYQPIVVALHLAEVALASLLVAGAMRVAARHSRGRPVIALLGASVLSAYWLVAVVSAITNEAWGWSVSIDLARAYLPYLPGIVHNLPVSRMLVVGAVAAGGCLMAVFCTLWWRGAPHVAAHYRQRSAFHLRDVLAAAALVAFILVARRSPAAAAEPFTALFTPPGVRETAAARTANVAARDAYTAGRPANARNIVIIFSDALRADHMGVYGYQRATTPFLSRLDAEGKLRKVTLAMATCPFTACGVMSTLASRDSAVLELGALTIEDVLHDRGYRTHVIGASDHTVWYTLRLRYGDNVDYFFDGWSSRRWSLNDDRLVLEGLDAVPASTGQPAFFDFFLTSTHTVGVKLPAFRRWTPAELGPAARGAAPLVNAYDNGILQADSSIAQIFSTLDAKGYLAGSIVVILGDHGDAFGEHGLFGHTLSVYQETLHIPMIIYDADPAARYANLDFATQSDIAPTLLARLGLPAPRDWQGVSLVDGPPRMVSTHWTDRERPWHAVLFRDGGRTWKYMYALDWGSRTEELYELAGDPAEQVNRVQDPQAARALARVRARAAARWPADFPRGATASR